MTVTVPGFPVEVSERLDLPDIGELLLYPPFQGIEADDFLKYATEYQRYLLHKVPLRNDKAFVTVRSGVWLLRPGTRSHVNRQGNWHIDGSSDYDHVVPDERVYILSSPCSSLTQFNLNSMQIASPENETRTEFANRVGRSAKELGIVGRAIEPCRLYAFRNHLHRAVDPERIEFRFFFRVRETNNRESISRKVPLKRLWIRDAETGESRRHIEYDGDRISIYYPMQRVTSGPQCH